MIKHGYHPMHPAEKPVSHEKMLDILAKRTNQALPPNSVAIAATPVLEWGKPILTGIEAGTTSAYILSACGHYSVTRDVSGDSVSYAAYRRLPDLPGSNGRPYKQMGVHLGCLPTSDEAKALCAADAALHAP
jgi:hypothetical protein